MERLGESEITLKEAARLLKLEQEVVEKKCENGELDCRMNENGWLLDKESVLNDINEYVLWFKDDGEFYVINEEDICGKAYPDNPTMKIDGINIDKVNSNELMIELDKYKSTHPDFCIEEIDEDEMVDFFGSIGFENVSIDYAEEFNSYEETLFYDVDEQVFFEESDIELTRTYEFIDGGNWRTIKDRYDSEIVVSTGECSVDLDESDGSNLCTGGSFCHQEVLKIRDITGCRSQKEYLLILSDDYEESIMTGILMSLEELIAHLEKIHRDIDEYMGYINELD